MATLFRNFNTTRNGSEKTKDRENMPPAFGSAKLPGKENIFSERRHAGRKQAFGELKNVLHNTGAPTPMKTSKNQIYTPMRPMKNVYTPKKQIKIKQSPQTKKTTSLFDRARKVPSVDKLPKNDLDYDDLEYVWAQQTAALFERAMPRILEGGNDDDLILPLPDISSMETFESVFGEIEPLPLDDFNHLPEPEEPELPSLPSIEWDNEILGF